MFNLIGNLGGKNILELGCGNGYLGPRFLEQSPKQIIMMDISEHNLRHAAAKCDDSSVSFLKQDATRPWKVSSSTIDLVYSNMMLNEVENIESPIKEAFRVLKTNGIFVFSVTHPAWDLFIYAQEKVGLPSSKIKGLGGYFRRGFAKFIMGGKENNKTNPILKDKYDHGFEVEHFQRPISDYFNQLIDSGFVVKRFLEPELNEELLQSNPRFIEYVDNPIGLVFYCVRP
jgi:ubiquinone/menaquinone biosynthesis C-methylase UbiE